MKLKTATSALLVLILLCLAILILRGLRDGEPTPQVEVPESEPAANAPAEAANTAEKLYTTPSGEPLPPLTREDVHIFIEGLLKPELPSDVRVWTAWQLARASVEDEAVNQALRAILEDPDPQVAAAGAAALAQRGVPGIAISPEEPEDQLPSDPGESAPPGMRVETLD